MVVGEFAAVLVMVTVPVMFPLAVGAKITFSVAVFPGIRTCPADTPLALKPVPDTLTLPIVTLAFTDDSTTERVFWVPVLTFPKLTLAGLALSCTGPAASTSLRFIGGAGGGACAITNVRCRQSATTMSAV